MNREPASVAILAARIQRAYPALSPYSAASLATELDAIERAQRRHAERCCSGEDGGYTKWVDDPPRSYGHVVHDPDAERKAGERIERRVEQWGGLIADRLGVQLTSIGFNRPTVTLEGDPRGPVLLLRLPGEQEAS